ncbi:hypothetical protein [Micromonospora sp. NPDC093277]|uniref:hypothetical protein n=1 Tax=Micromonospora sp. NPDC093277 TaxID=3364291 RepID=UPI0038215DFB
MNRKERSIPATGYPEAPVLPWSAGQPPPTLPAGTAGISVHVRSRGTDPVTWDAYKAVGVDDRPMWQGLGRMVVVTAPGEHLVEVRGRFSAETVRRVRVAAGEIVELDCWAPASFGQPESVLVPTPGGRRPGAGAWVVLAPIAALAAFALGATRAGLPVTPPLAVALLLSPLLAVAVVSLVKRHLDLAYRVRSSREAVEDVRAADTGMFLADGAPPAGLTDGAHGALVVTGTARLDYRWNGMRVGTPATLDPNSWVPWPTLTIDGALRPFSWRTWAYRLPAGEHEVVVAVHSPAPDRPEVSRVAVRVRVAAGQLTRLQLRADTRTEVRANHGRQRVPTELAGFTATVEPRVR